MLIFSHLINTIDKIIVKEVNMTQKNILLDETIKAVRVKCYGTLKINGSDSNELTAISRDEESLNILKTGDTIFVTAIKNCELEIPSSLPVFVEKALGSLITTGMINEFSGEKVLGNLVLDGACKVMIEKVGGNSSVRNVSESVSIEKVGGTFAAESIAELNIEKIGGNCKLHNISGQVSVSKVGGNFSTEGVSGDLNVAKVGGNFTSDGCQFGLETKVGGNISIRLMGDVKPMMLYAGGDIRVYVDSSLTDVSFDLHAGENIKLKIGDQIDKKIDRVLEHQLGDGSSLLYFHAGGSIKVSDEPWHGQPDNGSFEKLFVFDDTNFHTLIHDNVQKATKIAGKKIEEAQKRLEEIGKRIENEFTDFSIPPIPNFSNSVSPANEKSKGASNEERLLILQMLQEKQITVDEAEKLFKTLEK